MDGIRTSIVYLCGMNRQLQAVVFLRLLAQPMMWPINYLRRRLICQFRGYLIPLYKVAHLTVRVCMDTLDEMGNWSLS